MKTKKKLVTQFFPVRGADAIYKKCGKCGNVYVKPVGCDGGTHCGHAVGQQYPDLPFRYQYTETGSASFTIDKDQAVGSFEQRVRQLRNRYSTMVDNSPHTFYGANDKKSVVPAYDFAKPCGQPLRWDEMEALTLDELKLHGLVPEGVTFAPTGVADNSRDRCTMIEQMAFIDAQCGLDKTRNLKERVEAALAFLDMDRNNLLSLRDQVQAIYNELGPSRRDG